MEWVFRRGGREARLEKLTEVVALPAPAAHEADSRGVLMGDEPLVQGGAGSIRWTLLSHEDAELLGQNEAVFLQAGWAFAPADAGRFKRTRGAHGDAEPAAREVYRDPAGNLQLGTDRLVVRLDPDLPEREVRRRLEDDSLTVVHAFGFEPHLYEVEASGVEPLSELVARLQDQPERYRGAEPLFLETWTERGAPPQPVKRLTMEQRYASQWQHRAPGPGVGGIHSEGAWNAHRRGQGMRIAVIDFGMQIRHRTLKPAIRGGGFFEENGFGVARFHPLPRASRRFPCTDHGTFCLGMAGSRWPTIGVRGSAPEAELMAIACLEDYVGSQTTLARAIAYAADPAREGSGEPGADVISCSIGPATSWDLTEVLERALTYAATKGRDGKGVPVFWAVNNLDSPIANDQICSHPLVIAVGRSAANDTHHGSAYGPELDFLGPGARVYGPVARNRYAVGTGASFATPLAAGVAALVLQRYPHFTAEEVREHLRATCDRIGGVAYDPNGHHVHYGYGRINAARAVQ